MVFQGAMRYKFILSLNNYSSPSTDTCTYAHSTDICPVDESIASINNNSQGISVRKGRVSVVEREGSKR